MIGGQAGGGKSFALLLDALRHYQNPRYRAALFRREVPELKQPGGLWQESTRLYGNIPGVETNHSELVHRFPSGAEIKLAGLQYEHDVFSWQGSRLDFVGFDELSHFTALQLWYLWSRLGSTSGINPVVRGTCNPDPDSEVAQLVRWYLDERGFAIPERAGVLRYFVRADDLLVWDYEVGGLAELHARYPDLTPRSFTFIPASLDDNPALTKVNPRYRANLQALPLVQRERLLRGNWHIRPSAGKVFNRDWFPVVDRMPRVLRMARGWDCAGTDGGGDYTVGLKLCEVHPDDGGGWIIADVRRGQWSMGRRDALIRDTAEADGAMCLVEIEQEPGSAGKDRASAHVEMLAGYRVRTRPSTGDKVTRMEPVSAQAEGRCIMVLQAPWTTALLDELHNIPDGAHDDQGDALALAFTALRTAPRATTQLYRTH